MSKSFTQRKRIRKTFGRIQEITQMPNLIEVQKASYDSFLQINIASEDRTNSGLQAVFKSVFPITAFSENGMLEFVKFELEEPKYEQQGLGGGIKFVQEKFVARRVSRRVVKVT